MLIKRLEIQNFKALESVDLLLDPKVNVVAGVNGSGKSTLINAVHFMFQRYISAMRTGRPVGRNLLRSDLRTGAERVRLAIEAEHNGKELSWWIESSFKGLYGFKRDGDQDSFRDFISEQLTGLEAPDAANVPLFTTYPVGRAVLDIPLRVRSRDATTQAAAFQSTALSTPRSFRSFFAWFRDREDYENERRVEAADYRDSQLSAVRTAVTRLMPGFEDLRVRRRPLRMVISKGGKEFEVNRLSDGEKGLLGLVGDLARRLALCNPALEEPLLGQGIVLIDELELHLHPAWQRHAVTAFPEVFPNIQFIFTTHSPQILSELFPTQVFLLNNGVAFPVERSYGMESSQILRELMGDPGRPKAVAKDLETLYAQLESANLELSERLLQELGTKVGQDDPALSVVRSKLRRTKVLRSREEHN